MASQTIQHVSYVLLAEFDINQGSILPHQYPFPTGTDDQLLAELMIPDGAHSYAQDWTIFFLNQTPANTITPVFSDTQSISENGTRINSENDEPSLLYVLNLVQTKKDPSVPRGGIVKALAICTRHPFIQIFQHVLVIALEDYFQNPSVEVLARLFDAVNAMDLSSMPTLSRDEKLVLRGSERRDTFVEKFQATRRTLQEQESPPDVPDLPLVQEDVRSGTATADSQVVSPPELAPESSVRAPSPSPSVRSETISSGRSSPDEEPWAPQDSADDTEVPRPRKLTEPDTIEEGTPTDASETDASHASRLAFDQRSHSSKATTRSTGHNRNNSWNGATSASSDSDHPTQLMNFDTHSFPTRISLNGFDLPIKIPTSTFPGEVSNYSLITLVQLLSSPTASISGPLHPHLHSNGALTHPLILLFNALITQKRVIFLGYGKPAADVAAFVLAACALASGSGVVLRGFTQRAFPYTNLTNNHVMISIPGFIAGVTNPIYETMPVWDVLCNIETGKITVHKDIRPPATGASSFPQPPSIGRSGLAIPNISDDEIAKSTGANGAINKGEFVAKADNADNLFMEDILASIAYHYGETLVRARFTEYVARFVRLAARYEEETFGSTKIGYATIPFMEGQLGSGTFVEDSKEIALNAGRIEGWRRSDNYEYFKADFRARLESRAIRGFDLGYQISRLRHARTLPDSEVQLTMRTLANNVRSYDQVVELLAHLPPHAGGLLPIAFGLFHPLESIRDSTVECLTNLRAYPIGVQFLQGLNHFHRIAYVRLAQGREFSAGLSSNGTFAPASTNGSQRLAPPASMSRSSSNLSSSSLGTGV